MDFQLEVKNSTSSHYRSLQWAQAETDEGDKRHSKLLTYRVSDNKSICVNNTYFMRQTYFNRLTKALTEEMWKIENLKNLANDDDDIAVL